MIEKGQKFHMLEVIEVLPKGRAIFKCECGKVVNKRFYNVIREKSATRSCGCLKRKLCRERNNKKKGIATKPFGHSAITKIMKQYRTGAKSRSLSFNLKRKDFEELVKKPCFYCGTEDSLIMKTDTYDFHYNGIDRKNNSLGYSKENVVTCCNFCNRAKYTYDPNYFIEMCRKVAYNNKD